MSKALTLDELKALAAEGENQTETTSGSFDYELPPTGVTVGRLIEYVELGKQKQRAFQGKPKPDNEEVRLTFELLAPKNRHEYEDEQKQKRVRYDRISFTIAKKLNEKAKYYKLFNQMRYGRDSITHMAQMLNDPLRLTIYHNKSVSPKDKKERTYANLWAEDGSMGIGAPVHEDALAGTITKIPVPEAFSALKIFLWNNPTVETWDSLFIDGEREIKDAEGNVVETRSKNWVQETILGASDYSGSKLEALLGGLTEDETPLEEEEVEDEVEEVKPAAKKAVQKVAAKVAPKAAAAKPAPAASKATAKAAPVGKLTAPKATKQKTDSDEQLRAMGLI